MDFTKEIEDLFNELSFALVQVKQIIESDPNNSQRAELLYIKSKIEYIFNEVENIDTESTNNLTDKLRYWHDSGIYKTEEWINILYSYIHQTIDIIEENKINKVLDKKLKEKTNRIEELESQLKERKEQNKTLTEKGFDLQSTEYSKIFDNIKTGVSKARDIYLKVGGGITLVLGIFYIYNYLTSIHDGCLEYKNHLLLLATCSPFIFIDIWIFCQIRHLTKLIDLYTHKAALAFTLKTSIDYTEDKESNSTQKEVTLKTLQNLLNGLYESPIKDNESKSIITKNISELTKLIKELKDLIHDPAKSN